MTGYLVGLLIGGLGLAVAKRETHLSDLLHERQLDLGPYVGRVAIGEPPERYPHLSAADKKAGNSIRRLLENLRDSLPTGIHGIPPLDPYFNNNLTPFSLNVPFLTGEVDVEEIMVTGLQAFKIELIELRLDTIRSDFIFTVPLLKGIVSFQANLALGGLFPLSIEGKLRVTLQNVTIEGAVGGLEINLQRKHFYTLKTLQVHFHAENVKVHLDGMNLERDILETLQSIDSLDSSFLGLQEPVKEVVNYYVAHEILNQLNNIIENFSVQEVKTYLLARWDAMPF